MKLSTAILLSVIAHIVLLLVFTNFHQSQPIKQIEDSQPIVTAQLIFTQPTPEPEPLPEPELKIEQEAAPQKERTQPTPEPVITAQQNLENPQEQKPEQQRESEQEQKTKQAQSTLPTASFDPYASLNQFINQQTSDFINNSSREQQQQRNNAINNIPSTITSINSTDDSPIKEIFETAQRIDADTRVVNYNGRCVQIKRELDANGFSQFKWTGTTLDCGLNADMKAQLKQSLSKFLKK